MFGILNRFGSAHGGCYRSRCEVGIEAAQESEKIAGTECEADAGDILADEFQGVQTDHFAAYVEQRSAGIAGVDGCFCLNSRAGSSGGEFANGTDDSFRNAEQHGITGIADDEEDRLALANQRGISEREIRKHEISRGRRGLDQSEVEIGVDINDIGLQLRAIRKQSEERRVAPSHVGIGGNHPSFCEEEPGASAAERLEAHDSGLSAAHELFERKLQLERGGVGGGDGRDGTGEGIRDGFEVNVEMVRFEKPVWPVATAVEIDPDYRAFGESNFVGVIAGKRDARDHEMFKALTKYRAGAVKISAGEALLERSGANRHAIELDGCARWIAGDFQRLGRRNYREEQGNCGKKQKTDKSSGEGRRERERLGSPGCKVY